MHASYEKLWTASFIKIFAVSFFIQFSYQMNTAAIPLFAQHIGGDKTVAGLMMSIFTISALLFRPLVGSVCDTRGRRIVLVSGTILFTLVSLIYHFAPFIWLLIVLRFLHGASFSAFSTSSGTIVADVVPETRMAEGVGYFGISMTVAAALGPALGLYLISLTGYDIIFILCFALAVLGVIFALATNYEDKEKYRQTAAVCEQETKKWYYAFIEPAAARPSFIMFFVALAQISIITFLPTYALALGIKNIGLFFTVQAIFMVVTRLFMGKLADKYGSGKILIPALILMVISIILLIWKPSFGFFIVAAILSGLGTGATLPILNSLTILLCPENRRGVANSMFFSAIDLGYGIGALIWGLVAEYIGFFTVFALSAGSMVVALLLFMLLMPKTAFQKA